MGIRLFFRTRFSHSSGINTTQHCRASSSIIIMEENKRSYSLEELETKTRRKLSESELKRQLSHDLANDPTFATVFNPPQIFSDEDNKTIVWTNNEPLVSSNFFSFTFLVHPRFDLVNLDLVKYLI